MPKKKLPPESQATQSERFNQAVRDAVAAGELNPTEADDALEKAMTGMRRLKDGSEPQEG